MSERVRCKINTEVFDTVDRLMKSFNKSILEIQTHINYYLDDASKDFERQLVLIERRLVEAKEEEERSKEMEEKAKIVWENATKARENAEHALQQARNDTDRARAEYVSAKEKHDAAFNKKEEAKEALKEASKAQQDAYYAMKNHEIDHDKFEEYQEDTADKKEEYYGLKEVFEEKKALLSHHKAELHEAQNHEKTANNDLKSAQHQEKSAKKAFCEAKKKHEEAVRECKRRDANLKEAKKIVQTFRGYKKDYYHPYYNLGQNSGCDSLLLVLRTNMRREFGLAMQQIHEAVKNILRCSLKEGMIYDDSYLVSTNRSQKSDDMRYQIKEGLRTNKVKLNREMGRPEDERPNYTECCKVCGRLILLCNCPNKNEPLSLTE